jgi:transposase
MGAPAHHMGIQNIQRIFIKNEQRLYHWADDRRVPAHNNRAERELRPTVVARKTSFGSQSEKGAKTRSTLSSILCTAKKRLKDRPPQQWLKETLDWIAKNGTATLKDQFPPPAILH